MTNIVINVDEELDAEITILQAELKEKGEKLRKNEAAEILMKYSCDREEAKRRYLEEKDEEEE
jgi:hypothetical protein